MTISVPEDDYDPANLQHITNFCTIIRQSAHLFVGFCLDDTGCLKSYSSLRTTVRHVQKSLTLEAILPHFEAKLSIPEVYGLAIALIASIFQLSQTPWLDTKWSKKNILFSRANNNLPLSVDLRYPYLAKDFHRRELLRNLIWTSSQLTKQSGDVSQQHCGTAVNGDCSNLLGLAIMLLEISSGQPVERRRRDDQTTHILPNDQSDLQLADEWLKEEKSHGRLSSAFFQAILGCLQEYLNPDANFRDDRYCDAAKEKVLLPLYEEMQYLLYGPPN